MTKLLKTIVFFGNEKLATGIPAAKPVILEAALKAGFEIEQVVTGKLNQLKPHKAKLAVLAAYGQIIPQRILDEFPLGIINVHPSLLPKHRGPTPIEQAILDGDVKTGVSIMLLSAAMDEGPIFKQKSIHIKDNVSKAELAQQLQQLGGNLLGEVLPKIADGSLKPRKQAHPHRASYSHLLTKADGKINWHKPAKQLEREIRAYAGWPGSHTELAGKEVIISKAKVASITLLPGELHIENNQLYVGSKEKSLKIECIKPAGKREMSARAFLAGHKL